MEQNGELNANAQTLKMIFPLTESDFLAWSQNLSWKEYA